MAYHRQQGVDTAIVRIFNTYGPRMRPHDGRAIPTFLRQALEEKPLTVFGDGSQTRSFCYVDDLVRGLILLAESGEHLPVNVGNPTEMTLLELAEAVLRATGIIEPDRLRGAPGRRSAGSPARHHPRPAAARLGAGGRSRHRAGAGRSSRSAGLRRCVGSARPLPRWLLGWRSCSLPRPAHRNTSRRASTTTPRFSTGIPTRSSRPCATPDTADPGQPVVGRARTASPHAARQRVESFRSRLRLEPVRPRNPVRARLRGGADLHDHRHAGLGEPARAGTRRRQRPRI